MRRVLIYLAAAFIVIAGLTGCSKNGGGKDTIRFRIGTQPAISLASMFYLKVSGYIEEELKAAGIENVEVSWNQFGTGPELNEAFASGALDIGAGGDVAVVLTRSSGQRTLLFAKVSYWENGSGLLVATDSPIQTVADLKGKRIATVRGSAFHYTLEIILERAGLTLDDITLINLPFADIGGAVALGQVDAGMTYEPFVTAALRSGTRSLDYGAISTGGAFFYTSERFAQNHPEILAAYIRALERAKVDIAADPKRAAELMRNEVSIDTETLAGFLADIDFSTYLSDQDVEHLKGTEAFIRRQRLARAEVDMDHFINRSFLKDAGVTR